MSDGSERAERVARSGDAGRLAGRLKAARHRNFVGRWAELDLVRSALGEASLPFAVLHIFGPGGVGKSTLLAEYGRLATEVGRPVLALDGREIEPSPSGFQGALGRAMGLTAEASVREALAGVPRALVLIDTYERLAPLDPWLREHVLPELPADSLVVIAGREPPAPDWRTDLAWADLTRVVALANLAPEESRFFLAARGIPGDQHAEALAFTHGHPLALALVADLLRRGDRLASFDPRHAPDVVRILLERLLRDLPSPRHRLALEACTLALVTTEALLADVVGADEAPALFAWLRGLSFIEQGPRGLFPHDLAREVIHADACWRDFDGYRRVGRVLWTSLRARIAQTHGADRQRLELDALYTIRSSPTNRDYFDWGAVEGVAIAPAGSSDAEAIVAMVRAHEGDASARLAAYWLRRQPEAFQIVRTDAGERFGFLAHLALHRATAEDVATDPAVAAALRFIERYGPARPGEAIFHLRFWMHQELYQAITAAINLTAMTVVTACTTHPNLAWNFTVMADADFWQAHFEGINWLRAPEADYEVGGRRYGAFAHDWRIEPAAVWLKGPGSVPMPHAARAPAVALSHAEFTEAVRQALRDYTRLDRLAVSPLFRSRLAARAGTTPAALAGIIREAVASLTASPRDRKFHRAIWHTYIEPASTQEAAAELLGLPFNTYRYHLTRGIERIANWLWEQERTTITG